MLRNTLRREQQMEKEVKLIRQQSQEYIILLKYQDTVGDPCKDTAGPSIHILIKLYSTITIVMAPLFVD